MSSRPWGQQTFAGRVSCCGKEKPKAGAGQREEISHSLVGEAGAETVVVGGSQGYTWSRTDDLCTLLPSI